MAEEKFKRKREREEAPAPVDKAAAIAESKMPDEQKKAYLQQLGLVEAPSNEGKIRFSVYAKIKRIDGGLHGALLAYPKAKGIKLATIQEWDEIFKDF